MPEDEEQRLNRELVELLNELRVILPGVRVLFAFLLAAPSAMYVIGDGAAGPTGAVRSR